MMLSLLLLFPDWSPQIESINPPTGRGWASRRDPSNPKKKVDKIMTKQVSMGPPKSPPQRSRKNSPPQISPNYAPGCSHSHFFHYVQRVLEHVNVPKT